MVKKEIHTNRQISKTTGWEGEIISGNNWSYYENMLDINASVLENKKILNFGCGSSNISKDLKNKGIKCDIVDLDFKNDPWTGMDNPLKEFTAAPFDIYVKLFKPKGETRQKLVNLKRKIAGTEDRTFVQGNGRRLPFNDQSFDYVLALWSTYQIPTEESETVFRELMRVGKILHISPIFKKDYEILTALAEEQNFHLISCQPLKDNRFKFSSEKDYSNLKQKDESCRIKIPEKDNASIDIIFPSGTLIADSDGGSTIIIKK